MTQEQWIAAVKEALKSGPVRFTYDDLRIAYKLSLASESSEAYPHYEMKIERAGHLMMSASYGTSPLEKVIQDHPLDRFTCERDLGYYLSKTV